ncbi:hypothetical protein ASG37_09135 [Sphingomonas sp. Leaf407]|nr:hypothetical protein ASE97_06425 [Sphingomonas sp. Leaf42]KQT28960.1 hypothetical protein ASG37_09135 [Sphingomonas sp. Leaf407]
MASRGPKTGTRKPANSRSRPVTSQAPAVAAAPEPIAVDAEPVQAAVPPVPFVADPAPAPVELEQKIEAAIAEVVEHQEPVAPTVTETPAEATPEATPAVDIVAAQVEEKTMDVTNEATAATQTAADKAQAFTQDATAKAQAMTADFNEKAKAAMEKGAKGFEEMNEMAKGNIEAMVEASRIAAKGLESLGQEMAEYGRKSFEHATSTAKTLASVKSPTEFMKLQSDYVRQSFDSFVAEASKTTEMMMKLAGDAAQPISNRVAVAADKVKTAA